MKILFINLSAIKFTVASPYHIPLGGSESCLCYLAREMALNHHDVTFVAHLPENSASPIMGINHFPLEIIREPSFFSSHSFEAILVCNAPAICPILKALSPLSCILLWNHILPEQPSMKDLGTVDILSSLDAIVYVSAWQKKETERRLNINKRSFVIGNGLTPAFENMFSSPQDICAAKKNRAVYTAVPYRGLQVLLNVMETLPEDTELELFSSMQVYQLNDDNYKNLYQKAALNTRIRSYGSVTQSALASHLRTAAFFTYPSTYEETFCIGVLEAMAAGLKVISTSLGALSETTLGFADLANIRSNKAEDLIRDYRNLMINNIKTFLNNPEDWAKERYQQAQIINHECTWSVRYKIWDAALQMILQSSSTA